MSLITRCPACGTMFKVVPDQLKVSQGWVRCGQCADVFDASLHLQTERAPHPDLGVSPVESVAVPVASDVAVVTDSRPPGAYSSTPETADFSYVEEVSAALKTADRVDNTAPIADPTSPILQAVENSIYSSGDGPDETPAEVSFVRDARRQAFWRRPLVRTVLGLLALLLMVLLALQWVVQHRDRLAVFEPRLKPALEMLCQVLACNVGPVRQIEAIVIDNSSFNKLGNSVYRLTFSIKNTAAFAVAMPSLEVTLTDTQDQAVLRSVLSPAQFGMASGLLDASSEFSGALALQLMPLESAREAASATSEASTARRVAGYRLLAFYP